MERNSNVASAHLSRKKATTSAATSESIYDYHDGDDKETLSAADARAEETSTSAADRVRNSSVLPADDPNAGRSMNPLLRQQLAFLGTLTAQERESFFSSELDPDRRGKIWTRQADLGERLVNTYAWATPDDRALAILRHFSPLIEIGCGARAYWCSQMDRAGIDVVGFDQDPTLGGKIDKESASKATLRVRQGGPEVLARPEFSSRNLFLCYPDENDDAAGESGAEEDDPQHPSLAYQCLQHFRGDYVIHVGEIFSDTVLAVDQAPWGRSSSPEFQQLLASEFHCLLRIGLPSWVHVRDTLTVWKRSEKCPIVFGGEDEGDTDECVYYRYVSRLCLPFSNLST
jgi:hypothetical protein